MFGIKLNEYEEAICAWVVLKDTSLQTKAEEIIKFCMDNIADNKVPKYVKFVEDFENKTSLGKLQRSKMAEIYKEERKKEFLILFYFFLFKCIISLFFYYLKLDFEWIFLKIMK